MLNYLPIFDIFVDIKDALCRKNNRKRWYKWAKQDTTLPCYNIM